MTDESHFLDALRADPTDVTVLLVYADWLEERGDPRAEYIHLSQDPLKNLNRIDQLRLQLKREWVYLIDECGKTIQDPKIWEEVQRIDRGWLEERKQYCVYDGAPGEPELPELCPILLLAILGVAMAALGSGLLWLAIKERDASVFLWSLGAALPCLGATWSGYCLSSYLRFSRARSAYEKRRARVVAVYRGSR